MLQYLIAKDGTQSTSSLSRSLPDLPLALRCLARGLLLTSFSRDTQCCSSTSNSSKSKKCMASKLKVELMAQVHPLPSAFPPLLRTLLSTDLLYTPPLRWQGKTPQDVIEWRKKVSPLSGA